MAGTTRLKIYNGALQILGLRQLGSLTEARKSRRALDLIWNRDGARACLELGEWQFAMRAQELEHDAATDTQFQGFNYAFNKPPDWVATHAVCADPSYKVPLLEYADETDYWFASITPIYVKYVSDDEDWGMDLSRWPQSFCDFVDCYFASKACIQLTGDKTLHTKLVGQPGKTDGGELGKLLKIAKSRAAMTQATRFPAPGTWSRAHLGNRSRRNRPDGGNTGSLIG